MKLSAFIALATAIGASATFDLPSFEQFAVDSGLALAGLNGMALLASANKYGGGCNLGNVKFRREWRTLSKAQRKRYVAAVKCVQKTPSILAPGVAAGSKNLFDDFVYVHLQSTLSIHFTGNFLIWHRYYIHHYEQRLQACGYDDSLPYWEWGHDVNNPHNSPIFDGSETSLGSDGKFIPGGPLVLDIPGNPEPISLAKGTGGGCVHTGPFSDMTVRLGPITQPDPTADNPRCLKRDLNADAGKRFSSFRNTTELIANSPNIEIFRTTMEADPSYVPNSLGVHGGGHFMISGDPGSDAFISSGDPAFYLHHAQIDRVYWIWQMLDWQNRQGVFGTNTMLNFPPSANTTVEDNVDLTPLAGPIKIKNLMSTTGGGGSPLCYVYL
ncbi:tyrosinase-like protein [Chaetomidium leptoderma]|uniref:Tyrosinase-like protein n=1 Tax=Chaetomidium leptoderma TaxID=669021 RepID=A0AAN6VCR0_9PEZI|nr:tyrosinase-like protein [Chaetomidium leptoderma]